MPPHPAQRPCLNPPCCPAACPSALAGCRAALAEHAVWSTCGQSGSPVGGTAHLPQQASMALGCEPDRLTARRMCRRAEVHSCGILLQLGSRAAAGAGGAEPGPGHRRSGALPQDCADHHHRGGPLHGPGCRLLRAGRGGLDRLAQVDQVRGGAAWHACRAEPIGLLSVALCITNTQQQVPCSISTPLPGRAAWAKLHN